MKLSRYAEKSLERTKPSEEKSVPKKNRTPRAKKETLEQRVVREFMEGERIASLAWTVPGNLHTDRVERTEEIIRKNMSLAAKLRLTAPALQPKRGKKG